MKNNNFTITDIKKLLTENLENLAWTGKVYDEDICDYKDVTPKDFETRSMHSFLFINREKSFCERDIQISSSNFKIYEDSELSPVDKDLSQEWVSLLTKKDSSLDV